MYLKVHLVTFPRGNRQVVSNESPLVPNIGHKNHLNFINLHKPHPGVGKGIER